MGTEESSPTISGNPTVSLPTVSGQVTIWNNFDVEIKGVVDFVSSTGCKTDNVEFRVQPGRNTLVQYSGDCNVFEITGSKVNSQEGELKDCVKFEIVTGIKEFYIIKNKYGDCQIATIGGTVQITNQYNVAIQGIVDFGYGQDCFNNVLPYTVNAGSTEKIYYFGTCDVSKVEGGVCDILYLFNGDTTKAFNIVTKTGGGCEIQ